MYIDMYIYVYIHIDLCKHRPKLCTTQQRGCPDPSEVARRKLGSSDRGSGGAIAGELQEFWV